MGVAPLNDLKVRQAIGYSIDRDAIVKALFGKLGVTTALNVINAPIVSSYSDTNAFAGYKLDLSKANSLLTGDGYAKGSRRHTTPRTARSWRSPSGRPPATSAVS